MKLGLISDIHGNVLALEAVLTELARERVDRLVCLGDVAVGPQACEALDAVRALDCPVVVGNWDVAMLDEMPAADEEVERMLVEIAEFWAARLRPTDRQFMRTFVPSLEIELAEGVHALCFHGSPRSPDDFVFATTGDAELTEMFAGADADVFVGGHTHLQLVRRIRGSVLVNPGSVGLPFWDWWPNRVRIAPWAEYGIVEWSERGLRIDLRRTAFDVKAFKQLCLDSGMPHADWWVGSWKSDAPTTLAPAAPAPLAAAPESMPG